jgi:hypothetical protein
VLVPQASEPAALIFWRVEPVWATATVPAINPAIKNSKVEILFMRVLFLADTLAGHPQK